MRKKMDFSMPWNAGSFDSRADTISRTKLQWQWIHTFANEIDLLSGEVVETPVCLIDGNPKWPTMHLVMILGELSNWHTSILFPDHVPETCACQLDEYRRQDYVRRDAHIDARGSGNYTTAPFQGVERR